MRCRDKLAASLGLPLSVQTLELARRVTPTAPRP